MCIYSKHPVHIPLFHDFQQQYLNLFTKGLSTYPWNTQFYSCSRLKVQELIFIITIMDDSAQTFSPSSSLLMTLWILLLPEFPGKVSSTCNFLCSLTFTDFHLFIHSNASFLYQYFLGSLAEWSTSVWSLVLELPLLRKANLTMRNAKIYVSFKNWCKYCEICALTRYPCVTWHFLFPLRLNWWHTNTSGQGMWLEWCISDLGHSR